ncbi:Zn2Cys6 transcriptional regulator [Trichoderma simmonsii]|uniref:Zn2Cys6 transcriptional regulator n=1 Tax=Trichoderma simmonsii TaxID=1491479 RepID=A0A8G0LLA5_9HYPO|nr:Zn2Cys6 transcriptional regulator [Trichoderma simmonsii]
MSDGRAGMNRQFRNTNRHNFDPSQLYAQREPSGSGQREVPTDDIMGANPHFGDFNFPFSAIPDLHMPDQPGINNHQADPFSQHQPGAMTSVPPHNMNAVNSIARQPFVPIHDQQMPSVELPNGSMGRKSTPASNSITDDGNDEFGLLNQNRGDGTDLGGKSKDDSSSAPPAWSELKTKAGKDRKRLPLACIACRRKKIRCSGEKPACKHCMRSRIPCVYKVTTRKAAPRTDYMAMLDKRLKRMEERIIKILPKSDQETISTVPRAVVKPAIPGTGTMSSNKVSTKKRNADEAFGRDLEAWAKAPRPKLPEDHAAGSPESREAAENELLREGREALPPKDVQEHLTEVFFDNVYGQSYHLLHKPSYIRKLKNDTLPPVLVLSVCAIAARFTSSPKFNSTTKQFMRGEEWASHARDICTKRYDWPNITILTCLLILGMHEFGTCHGGRAWALGGQAIRMAFALHLHKDLEYDPQSRSKKVKLSFIDREIRRRVMWACFMMDRFNSSGTDRPVFIKEETIKIPLPVAEKYFQFDMPAQTEFLDGSVPESNMSEQGEVDNPRDNMGPSAYTIRCVSIWGRVVTYLNQGGREQDPYPMWNKDSEYAKLVRDTEELLRTLPESLQCTREALEIHRAESTAKHLLYLHMAIQQNLLFLHQAAVSFSQDRVGEEAPDDFIPRASVNTFAAANRISDLIRDAEEVQCSISTPFAGYCAFSSATIHITGIFSGNPAMKATAEANSSVNVRFLRNMMKYWGMFHWMVENIRIQFRNALDAARTGGPNNGSTASSPILQYSDWFNRYPHGVSDTDYMDPAVYRKKERGEDGALEQKPELQSIEEFFTAVGPMLNDKDGQRPGPSKRKGTLKKPTGSNTGITESQKTNEQHAAAMSGQHLHDQMRLAMQQQQQQQQSGQPPRFPNSLGVQTTNPSGFNSLTVSQPQNSTYPMMPLGPANAAQFPQSVPLQNFFSTDLLSMNMEPSNSMMNSLDKQISYGDFSMDAGNVLMNGSSGWGGMSGSNPQPNSQIHGQQGMKAENMSGDDSHTQDQMGNSLNPYLGQDASPGWFLQMEGQDMGFGSVDPFANLFGSNGGMLMADHQGGM